MKNIYLFIATAFAATTLIFSAPSQAAYSPISLTILPPIQFPPSDFDITGFRLSLLWGSQRDVYGLDLGLLGNITQQDFVGVGVSGLVNLTKGNTTITGLQLAGLTNVNMQKTNVYGVQASLVNYNEAESAVNGVQFGAFNLSSHTTIRGFQFGVYNRAKTVYGMQLGLVNMADNLHGIQIGLLNFHHTGLFFVAPVLNIGF